MTTSWDLRSRVLVKKESSIGKNQPTFLIFRVNLNKIMNWHIALRLKIDERTVAIVYIAEKKFKHTKEYSEKRFYTVSNT